MIREINAYNIKGFKQYYRISNLALPEEKKISTRSKPGFQTLPPNPSVWREKEITSQYSNGSSLIRQE